MNISIIVAADEQNAIGINGNIPWHLPADFKRFKEITIGHPVIVGQKTFESIGKPLPQRTNIIVTNIPDYKQKDCLVAHSIEEAIDLAKKIDEDIFVIGGGQIYKLAMPFVNKIYLTRVHKIFNGDVFFPEIDDDQWELVASEFHKKDEQNKEDFTFLIYKRK
jgi:dihydrofolate reductase